MRASSPARARRGGALRLLVPFVGAAALVTAVGAWRPSPPAALAGASATRPNIVFVLTDDLSRNLVTQQFMPSLWALRRQGTVFSNYFVADSLCCPSRATILTGRFPDDTGVEQNIGPHGGVGAFNAHGDQFSTIATDLQAAGYRTAMMGKYLNRYHTAQPAAPGWSTWDVADWGYPEFNYALNENGTVVQYGGPGQKGKDNYLTDVLSGLADQFVTSAAKTPQRPFYLEVATFAPHSPYTPAPRDATLYPGLTYPRTPAYDAATRHPPFWLAEQPKLTAADQAAINAGFRKRAQSVKSVDELIANLEATLRRTGAWSNTYFVFSSDNGLHMGEHRLMPGKLTAFDTDIHVPLIVVGPRVPHGRTVSAFSENVDLRSTFDALAGTRPSEPVDGRSLTPLLFGPPAVPTGWRQGVLVEHMGPVKDDTSEPDAPGPESGNPPTYEALRLANGLYVEYASGAREYYDLSRDPYELDNVYGSLPLAVRTRLHATLAKAVGCSDRPACSQIPAVTGTP